MREIIRTAQSAMGVQPPDANSWFEQARTLAQQEGQKSRKTRRRSTSLIKNVAASELQAPVLLGVSLTPNGRIDRVLPPQRGKTPPSDVLQPLRDALDSVRSSNPGSRGSDGMEGGNPRKGLIA